MARKPKRPPVGRRYAIVLETGRYNVAGPASSFEFVPASTSGRRYEIVLETARYAIGIADKVVVESLSSGPFIYGIKLETGRFTVTGPMSTFEVAQQ